MKEKKAKIKAAKLEVLKQSLAYVYLEILT